MATLSQRSFSGGEISPSLYARVDFNKYQTSLRQCRNFIVQKHGGVANRPGTKLVGEVKDSTKKVRLIPFVFNRDQTYVLEFGENYIRFIKDGAYLKVLGVPYEVTTTYQEEHLPYLQFVQSADVLTIVNKNYAPSELKRIAETNWTFLPITFRSDVVAPSAVSASTGSGTRTREYKVTAIRKEDYKESSVATAAASTSIITVTNANPARMSTPSGFVPTEGDEIYITASGMTELNDRRFFVSNITTGATTEFDLIGEDSTNYSTFTSGNLRLCFVRKTQDSVNATTPITVTWGYSNSAEVQEFNIYRRDDKSGAFGLVGVSRGNSFVDVGITPDTKYTPPTERNPFLKSTDWPGTVNYFQQRLVMGNTTNDPEKIFTSKIGDFKNFGVSSPIQDDDGITFKISGRQVNEVKHLLDLSKLVAFTSGGEYVINGNDASILSPTSVNTQQQSYNGASFLSPLVINDTALYVQERGSVVRDIAFRFEADGYAGDDLTIFAFHLFEGYTLADWTYQQVPHSVAWAVRSDGVLLGLTYLKEQRILAWHRHDCGSDLIENVCSVPESDEDVLYLVVKRSGQRLVEKFATRKITNVEDAIFLDSSLSYDGRNTTATTMSLTEYSSGGWEYGALLTLTASAGFFTAGDVGNSIFLNDGSGNYLRLNITEYISSTVVRVVSHRTVPLAARGSSNNDWKRAVDVLTGLDHLEGRSVSVLGDGFVVANPNNPSYEVVTVSGGSITLDKPYAVIHVGLPYNSDVETLNIDTPSGESIADKKMIVTSVNLFCEKSRGGFVGPKPPTDESTDGLIEFKVRNDEGYDAPVNLVTGSMEVTIDGEYNDNGRVFFRQTDPLPFTILSLQPSGLYPFRG